MLTCSDVTRYLSESMDRPLPVGRRVGVRLHLLMCRFCTLYKRQLLLIREIVRRYVSEEESRTEDSELTLTPEARDRIRRSLGGR